MSSRFTLNPDFSGLARSPFAPHRFALSPDFSRACRAAKRLEKACPIPCLHAFSAGPRVDLLDPSRTIFGLDPESAPTSVDQRHIPDHHVQQSHTTLGEMTDCPQSVSVIDTLSPTATPPDSTLSATVASHLSHPTPISTHPHHTGIVRLGSATLLHRPHGGGDDDDDDDQFIKAKVDLQLLTQRDAPIPM